MKILFENFIENKRTYNLCQGYFTRLFKHKLQLKFEKKVNLVPNQYHSGRKIYDANPMYCYLAPDVKKSVRIILLDKSEYNDFEGDLRKISIASWTDAFIFEDQEYQELVLSVILTDEVVEVMASLIMEWLKAVEVEGFEGFMKKQISDYIQNL